MHNTDNHFGAPRRVAVLAVMAGAALLAAACGGSSPSTPGPGGSSSTGASTIHAKQLAFAQCMRSHGVPNFPDPSGNTGGLAVAKGSSGINPQSAQFQAAQQTCRHLLPNGGQITPAQLGQAEQQLLKLAKCMRAHGVPDFPDPNGQGQVQDSAPPGSDLNPNSPQFQAAQKACKSVAPARPQQAPG
jgi:hypothetical protein